MKTCVAVDSSGGILVFEVFGRGEVGVMLRKRVLSLLRYSEGSGREVVEVGVKNSPGKRSVVP